MLVQQNLLSKRQVDYITLLIFLLARHGKIDRARVLVDALIALGVRGEKTLVARIILKFLSADYQEALQELEDVEDGLLPRIASAKRNDLRRTLTYIRARCCCELDRRSEGERIARKLLAEQ
ncbi:hypothetical protein FIV00_25950 [Labrenzia sp. THAF82]|uniref:hypothetical protein n=1 Tax=Labrenzia sp. THAF82 TaxID=2587861 RepID=UPI001267E6C4|nr:hypothetical protein [Labrenzia sp. THAF82]QFT33966.1 hypothetical protein FIV00_25950 [Labrenzia sp. THAF82]